MKIVIFSLLVVSLVHAAAPPADDADALRRRIAILESEKSKLEGETLLLREAIVSANRRLLAMKEEMEIMRVELGVPPKPPGPDMPLFDEYVDAQRKLMPPSMDDVVAARLADKDKATTAEVVVRGIPRAEFMVQGVAQPPHIEWTYGFVVTHVFKAPPKPSGLREESLLGKKIIVKANRALKGPVTLYLVFEEEKDFRLIYRLQGFSHVGPHAALPPSDPALGPK